MTRETMPIYMRRSDGGSSLRASTHIDGDLLGEYPRNVDLEVTIKHRKRSLPQLRAYWAGLHALVKATECYPSAEKLHEAIKWHLGFTTKMRTILGREIEVVDSAAFNKMNAAEFKAYLDRAQRLCLEQWGFDIMEKAE